jgi:arylsulfatase A-like enzyme
VQNDLQLGAIEDVLHSRALLDSTEIYVTTDHGFDGIFHTSSEKDWVTDTFFASRNPNLRSGPASVLDVVPTILSTFGVSSTPFDPPYRGVDLNLGPIP